MLIITGLFAFVSSIDRKLSFSLRVNVLSLPPIRLSRIPFCWIRLLGMNISAADTVCPAFREDIAAPDFSVTIFSAPQLKRSIFVGSLPWSWVLAVTIANMHKHLKPLGLAGNGWALALYVDCQYATAILPSPHSL